MALDLRWCGLRVAHVLLCLAVSAAFVLQIGIVCWNTQPEHNDYSFASQHTHSFNAIQERSVEEPSRQVFCRAADSGEGIEGVWSSPLTNFITAPDALLNLNVSLHRVPACRAPVVLVRFASYGMWQGLVESEVIGVASFAAKQFFVSRRIALHLRDYHRLTSTEAEREMCLEHALHTSCAAAFIVVNQTCLVLYPVVGRDFVGPMFAEPGGGELFVFLHAVELRPTTWLEHLRLDFVSPTPVEDIVVDLSERANQTASFRVALHRRVGEFINLQADSSLVQQFDSVVWRTECDTGSAKTLFGIGSNLLAEVPPLPFAWEITLNNTSNLLANCVGGAMRVSITLSVSFSAIAVTNFGFPTQATLTAKREVKLLPRANTVKLLFDAPRRVAHVASECGARLINKTAGEFCVSNLLWKWYHCSSSSVPASRQSNCKSAAAPTLRRHMVVLAPVEYHQQGCLRLVDGYVSYVESSGGEGDEARFPSLILQNICGLSPEAWAAAPSTYTVRALMPFSPPLSSAEGGEIDFVFSSVDVNLRDIQKALASHSDVSGHTANSKRKKLSAVANASGTERILISLCVHQGLDALEAQLKNIAAFVRVTSTPKHVEPQPASVVVLHISPMWTLTAEEWARLHRLNGTAHPFVIVNPHRHPVSFSLLAAVQLRNVKYVCEAFPWLNIEYVLLMASNELFLRRGIVEFVRRFDASTAANWEQRKWSSSYSYPRSAIRMFHSYPNGKAHDAAMIDTAEDVLLRPSTFPSWSERSVIPPFGVAGCVHWLKRALERHALTPPDVLPTMQLFTEGSYFKLNVALWLDNILSDVFPLDSVHNASEACFQNWYSWSEVVLHTVLYSACKQRLACGPRVGSVAWNRPDWFVTPRDIWLARCSPFDGFFIMKRVSSDPRNAARRLMTRLTAAEWNSTARSANGRDECNYATYVPIVFGL